jgi:small subunit ribosomal protein S16
MVKIRLSRGGRTHAPIYTIVAANSRNARDGKFLEKLGQYNPTMEKDQTLSQVNVESIKSWIGKGAQVSDTVRSLLKSNKIALS